MRSAGSTLLPMPTNTWTFSGASAITRRGSSSGRSARCARAGVELRAPALDANPHVARMADRPGLIDADAHPIEWKLRQQQQCQPMGQRLDQMELRCLYPGEDSLGDCLVVHRIGDGVAPGGALAVAGKLQIDDHGLRRAA